MAELQVNNEGRLYRVLDWQSTFDPNIVKQIERNHLDANIVDFTEDGHTLSCQYKDEKKYYKILLSHFPTSLQDTWSQTWGMCSCPKCSGMHCIHIGAMLVYREAHYGPFMLTESDQSFHARQLKEQRSAEINRRSVLQRTLGNRQIPVSEAIGNEVPHSGILMYDFPSIIAPMKTSEYAVTRVSEIVNDSLHKPNIHVSETILRDGTRELTGKLDYYDALGYCSARMIFHTNTLAYCQCNCSDHHDILCEHMLLLIRAARAYTVLNAPSDLTDQAATAFFRSIENSVHSSTSDTELQQGKTKTLLAVPRISVEDGIAKLSLKIGHINRKPIVIRNLPSLMSAYRHESTLLLSKKESIDFSSEDFTEECKSFFAFMLHRYTEIQEINDQKASKTQGTSSNSIPYQQVLLGSLLDQFYNAAEGMLCEYEDKSNNIATTIQIGHCDMSFTVYVDRLGDANGRFSGVVVSGVIPVELKGITDTYILNRNALSRTTQKEAKDLQPFRSIASASGLFRFHVGLNNLQEFYYRIIPALSDSTCIHLEDHCSEESEGFLPPEPFFAFYCDLEESILSIKTIVTYAEKTYTLTPDVDKTSEYHDVIQEQRVRKAVTQYANQYNPDRLSYCSKVDEEALFVFLQEGIASLSRFGPVNGTERFRTLRVHTSPNITVGVSIKSDLIDLSITSRDMDEDELLAVLECYQKKQKYYRLHSGDYLDLEQCSEIEDILRFFQSMDLVPMQAIKEKLHLPLFRALYIDRLLEEHDNVASSRDRTYRSLVKNFKTVKDADFDIPDSLEKVLRPYQSFGFKWLSTLAQAGFGGILADEMGLGKTIQVIAFLLSIKERGITTPSLVVCPSSLVFNWKEEIHKFAPDLTVQTLSGSQSVRTHQFQSMIHGNSSFTIPSAQKQPVYYKDTHSEGDDPSGETDSLLADVYITSYDLLKRDLAYYDSLHFYSCILDEAQFIKNQKAAISKSVKTIHADHRFALTGTPIENRLSELWSIFDYLMPGFLYTSADFINRFESPITKNKDEEATNRLKQMVRPFILRRKKEDVLKELPAKLEEVRYAQFHPEQQTLYDAQVLHMRKTIENSKGYPEDRIKIFAELTRIRQICCDPSLYVENYHGSSAKREACLELIESTMDAGHRMLVFSQFSSMLSLLEKDLKERDISYLKITGDTPKERRLSMVHDFNEGTIPVFLISLKAGGAGLNLTGADVVIHYDPWWNLAAQNQATDRAHRIGQTKQVTVLRLIMKGTIEEKILELQNAKKTLADEILEGRSESIMNMSKEELLDLLS